MNVDRALREIANMNDSESDARWPGSSALDGDELLEAATALAAEVRRLRKPLFELGAVREAYGFVGREYERWLTGPTVRNRARVTHALMALALAKGTKPITWAAPAKRPSARAGRETTP
jgi:hypothetical protein